MNARSTSVGSTCVHSDKCRKGYFANSTLKKTEFAGYCHENDERLSFLRRRWLNECILWFWHIKTDHTEYEKLVMFPLRDTKLSCQGMESEPKHSNPVKSAR